MISKKMIIIYTSIVLFIMLSIGTFCVVKHYQKTNNETSKTTSTNTLETEENENIEINESDVIENEVEETEEDFKNEDKKEEIKPNNKKPTTSNTSDKDSSKDKETSKKPSNSSDKTNQSTNNKDSNNNKESNNNNSSGNSSSNSNSSSSSSGTSDTNKQEELKQEDTPDEIDILRKSLENKYNITIKYGKELGSYRPKNLTPTPLEDKDKIKNILNRMNTELKKYPTGFFKEFTGMPLTIYLVSSVPNNSFSGFTDKEFMYDIKITLLTDDFFESTLHHEIMHYIDAYLEIKNYNRNPNYPYDEYMLLNPTGFSYGNTNKDYVYASGKNYDDIYFISEYSKLNVREDRAEIFKYIMFRSYMLNGMFEKDEVTTKKALLIDKQLRENFKTIKGTMYYDKFIKKWG